MALTSRRVARLAFVAALTCLAWAVVQLVRAGLDARDGRRALSRAEAALDRSDVAGAERELDSAERKFADMGRHVRQLGPAGYVLRVTPFVRIQLEAVAGFADAGHQLSDGVGHVATAVRRMSDTDDAKPLDVIRDMAAAADKADEAVRRAEAEVDAMRDDRLLWPLSRHQREVERRLPDVRRTVDDLRDGLAATDHFIGGAGRRRYLVLSQNPDEVRPTGGFIGTYGVLTADAGALRLERFAPIEDWYRAHPGAAIPVERSPSALQFAVPQSRQNISNVNTTPDWPRSAALAREMWRRGGEQPVDGVISVTPDFLARVLRVLGPTKLPSYPETVTADNVIALSDRYTHRETAPQPGGRKGFVVELAKVVLDRLLAAPHERWPDLAEAAGTGLAKRELLVWSTDPEVTKPLAERGWDGSLPETAGDFLALSEFSYARKNGRGLRRVFDQVVDLRPDGSARIETTLTTTNTAPPGRLNPDSQSYVVLYGPGGATLHRDSDPPDSTEPPLAGHPAAGWLRAAAPGRRTTIEAVWEAPRLLVGSAPDWRYRLEVRPTPAHTGDVLRLRVTLPPGWRWDGASPDGEYRLDDVLSKEWVLRAS